MAYAYSNKITNREETLMKIALMSGAFVNAGDFLIEERCKSLLEANISDAHIDIFKRNISYDDKVDMLNDDYDMIVFGGGPGFQKNIYPDRMPFVSDISKITTPIAIMGWGWKGADCSDVEVYRGKAFSPAMQQFIHHISRQSTHIGCRDWYTVNMLKEAGITNTIMTGCPAWYRLDLIENLHLKKRGILSNPKPVIMISDPAFPENMDYMRALLETVHKAYPQAHIKILLHRGSRNIIDGLTKKLKQIRFHYEIDAISGSSEGFKQYESCDLHIGFRVHAHIYNLSMGTPSILINEDARGSGVNDALGIRNVSINKYLDKQLYDYFDYLEATDLYQYERACDAIKFYYAAMQKYIGELKNR